MQHKRVGVTTKELGNGETRIMVTDDPKVVKAMRIPKKSHTVGMGDYTEDEPGCITRLASGIEIDVNNQKMFLRFGQPRV